MPGFGDEIDKRVCSQVIDTEYAVAKINQSAEMSEFDGIIDLLDARRTDKDYEWMSDIRVPEFVTHVLTQASMDVATYFRTRDYVEVYLEDQSEEALLSAEAAAECINRTLNQRHLNYYLKFVRSRMINQLFGRCYAECNWNQKVVSEVYGYKEVPVEMDVDIHGHEITDRSVQVPQIEFQQEELSVEVPTIDRFEFDMIDPRNVFTDNSYSYTLQEKPFVIIRSEKTFEDLKVDSDRCGYFNLDVLEETKSGSETETRRETYDSGKSSQRPVLKQEQWFDVFKRYGKMWVIVQETDPDDGYPTKVKPGIDTNGEIKPKAEYHECVVTVAKSSNKEVLIGFTPCPTVTAEGIPYRPIIRSLCYVHPVVDGGFGDGKHSKELQTAIDDTFNISMDRTKLATIPTLEGYDSQEF